jgi:FixJ family two-component response regulator
MAQQTVMVVDDDPALLTAVAGLIQFHLPTVRVQPFKSPRVALAQFQKKEVASIVTDLKMPEMDGLALLRGAKALRPHVPVILCSGHIDSALASKALSMGAQGLLPKPFSREGLVQVLWLALKVYGAAREVQTRRSMVVRLGKQQEDLRQVILASRAGPNTSIPIKGLVLASRNLTDLSLTNLDNSLDRLRQSITIAEANLDAAQHRLIAVQQQSCEECFLHIQQ